MTTKKRPFDKTTKVSIPADHRGKSLDDDGTLYDVVEAGLLTSPAMTRMELVNLAREVLGDQGSPEERRVALRALAGASLRFYWAERERPRLETRIREVFAHPMHATIVKNMGSEFGPDKGSHLNTLIGQLLRVFADEQDTVAKVDELNAKIEGYKKELHELHGHRFRFKSAMRDALGVASSKNWDDEQLVNQTRFLRQSHDTLRDRVKELENLRNDRVDELIGSVNAAESNVALFRSQRDEERSKHATTQSKLDQFMGVCADQAIQIMELRSAVMSAEQRIADVAYERDNLKKGKPYKHEDHDCDDPTAHDIRDHEPS